MLVQVGIADIAATASCWHSFAHHYAVATGYRLLIVFHVLRKCPKAFERLQFGWVVLGSIYIIWV